MLEHGVVAGLATPVAGSVMRQMNLVPYSAVPVVAKPAVCIACSPVVDPVEGSAPQPRSMSPPKWAKSTTTITPRVVEQSLTASAPAGVGGRATIDVALEGEPGASRGQGQGTGCHPAERPRPARLTSSTPTSDPFPGERAVAT